MLYKIKKFGYEELYQELGKEQISVKDVSKYDGNLRFVAEVGESEVIVVHAKHWYVGKYMVKSGNIEDVVQILVSYKYDGSEGGDNNEGDQ